MNGIRQLPLIIRLIRDYYAPEDIYIFGSHAKGLANDFSDIDLLVIKDTHLPRRQRGKDLADNLASFTSKIDVLFLTPKELKSGLDKKNSFLNSIWMNAKKIY